MKVLMANKFFHLNGGSERVFFQEREFLARNSIEVIDFSMRDPRNVESPYSRYFIDNIDYDSARGFGKKLKTAVSFVHSSEAVAKLTKLLKKERPDIAHLHNIYHQLTPSIIPVLKQHGVKVVLTLHDCKLICPSYLALCGDEICTACDGRFFWNPITLNCQGSRGKGVLLAVEAFFHKWRKSYEGVDLFLAPSRFLADLVSRRVGKDKIRVLRNGIDSNAFQPNYADRGYALYFGRLSKEKGVETLLAAHKGISSEVPLKIVGTGPLLESLQVRFPMAEFLGYKSGEELNELIRNAAFVVVPSEWYENCSMVVLEAMAFGKPIIGSRIGGIPEQVEDGETGFLFEMGKVTELAEKMLALAADKELRLRMGRAAREKLERDYSLAAHCERLLDIYSELLGRDVREDELPPC
jgi:glycosyltransferase involved in cell wall biosynthesis